MSRAGPLGSYDRLAFAGTRLLRRPVMNAAEREWRLRRLSKMSPSEVGWRVSEHVRRKRWASQQVVPEFSSQSWVHPSSKRQEAPWDSARNGYFRPFATEVLRETVPDDAVSWRYCSSR